MPTVNRQIAGALISEVREKTDPEIRVIEGDKYIAYSFNELQATFIERLGREEFFGFIFSFFGNEILLSNDLTMMTYDEENDEGLSIEDEGFLKIVNQFLALRLKSLKEYSF